MKHHLFSRFTSVLLAVVLLAGLMGTPILATDNVLGAEPAATVEEQTPGSADESASGVDSAAAEQAEEITTDEEESASSDSSTDTETSGEEVVAGDNADSTVPAGDDSDSTAISEEENTDSVEVTEPAEEAAVELTTSVLDENGSTVADVTVEAAEGVIPEDAKLVAELLTGEKADKAAAELDEADVEYDGYMALDIHLEDADGNEVEPSGEVRVVMVAPAALPEEADPTTVAVQHHEELDNGEVKVEQVASATEAIPVALSASGGTDDQPAAVTADNGDVTAEFAVESFSGFTVTWKNAAGSDVTEYDQVSVTISDNIINTGNLVAQVSGVDESAAVTYTWYRSTTGNVGSWEKVERETVTDTQTNIGYEDENWLNAALDYKVAALDSQDDRLYYKVDVTVGETTYSSESYQVPYYMALQNGSFETDDPMVWKTTDQNGTIETGNYEDDLCIYGTENDKPSLNAGDKFAELNASSASTLYQDVLTVPGTTLTWQLSHRARNGLAGEWWKPGSYIKSAKDTMYVVIMSSKDADMLLAGIPTSGNGITQQDVINKMVEAVLPRGDKAENVSYQLEYGANESQTVTVTINKITTWSVLDGYGPLTYSSNGQWHEPHSDEYTVPEGQYATRFFFAAGNTGAGTPTVGNLIDEVWFSTELPPPQEQKGHLTITKSLDGIDGKDVPVGSFQFTVTDRNDETVESFSLPTATGGWTHTIQNLTADTQYTITESQPTNIGDFIYRETTVDGDKTFEKTVSLQSGRTSVVTFVNHYEEDTSDEYPVRFYLQDVSRPGTDPKDSYTDLWGKVGLGDDNGYLPLAAINTCVYEEDLVVDNDSHQSGDKITEHVPVQAWLQANKAEPALTMDVIAGALNTAIDQGLINGDSTVQGDNGEDYKVSDILKDIKERTGVYGFVYTMVFETTDGLKEWYRGNYTEKTGLDPNGNIYSQKSYHVHVSIAKNPGTLTIIKTFTGIDAKDIPSNYEINVRALDSNGNLQTLPNGTLTLENATSSVNGVYTWTLPVVSANTKYRVVEKNTGVNGMDVSAKADVTVDDGEATSSTKDPDQSGNIVFTDIKVENGKTTQVAITNAYTPSKGYLTINKALADDSETLGNGKDVFSFMIKAVSGKEIGKVWYAHVDGNGMATLNGEPVDVTIGDETKEVTMELPAGNYKITELSNINYTCTSIVTEADKVQTGPNINAGTITVKVGGNAVTTVTYTNSNKDTGFTDGSGVINDFSDVDGVISFVKHWIAGDKVEIQARGN